MEKSTKLIIAAVGLGGLGFFLYKKGLFSNSAPSVAPKEPIAPKAPAEPTKPTLKNAPTCPSGYKLQMVDVNCNGQDCEVHCVPIPAVPERKIMPIVKDEPFMGIKENTPIDLVLNPYVDVPQYKVMPVDNTFRGGVMDVETPIDPFQYGGYSKSVVNRQLNEMIYY